MPDVFVSYKREELRLVESVVDYLRECGLDVWIDQQIAAGTSFSLEITKNILSAKCVLVCWTKGSVNSLWVLSEAMFALERQVIIPVILERCVLPPPFNIIQYIDLTDSTGAFEAGRLEMLKPRLSALVGRALTSPSITSRTRTDLAQIAPAPETLGYSVDLAFVLDITGSMGPALESAKSIIVKLYGHLLSEFLDRQKQLILCASG
jgi:TIR domain-containing protein